MLKNVQLHFRITFAMAGAHVAIGMKLRNYFSSDKKWPSYEWEYDEIERKFFIETNTFESLLRKSFSQLKTKHLTRPEWRKVRKMLRMKRRFSPKFVLEERVKLRKLRLKAELLLGRDSAELEMECESAEWQRMRMLHLIVETKKLLAEKEGQLQEFSSALGVYDSRSDNRNLKRVAADIFGQNKKILANLDLLSDFEVVMESILSKTSSAFSRTLWHLEAVSEENAERKLRENEVDTSTDPHVCKLSKALLTLFYSLIQSPVLGDHFTQHMEKKLEELEELVGREAFETFKQNCLPMLWAIYNKLTISNRRN